MKFKSDFITEPLSLWRKLVWVFKKKKFFSSSEKLIVSSGTLQYRQFKANNCEQGTQMWQVLNTSACLTTCVTGTLWGAVFNFKKMFWNVWSIINCLCTFKFQRLTGLSTFFSPGCTRSCAQKKWKGCGGERRVVGSCYWTSNFFNKKWFGPQTFLIINLCHSTSNNKPTALDKCLGSINLQLMRYEVWDLNLSSDHFVSLF